MCSQDCDLVFSRWFIHSPNMVAFWIPIYGRDNEVEPFSFFDVRTVKFQLLIMPVFSATITIPI